jgi:hypothetical protein
MSMPSTSSARTQRWLDKTASYRPVGEPFARNRYEVLEISKNAAEAFTVKHHYSNTFPATRLCYGLYDARRSHGRVPELVGVAALGVPSHPAVLTNPFPSLTPYAESLDLSRLVLLDHVPANAESWFCARAFALAAEHGIRGLVAFSDPVERWRIGAHGRPERFMPGHYGYVYQALNFSYLGTTTPRRIIVLPDGAHLPERSLSKITSGERGADGIIARLLAKGAPPLEEGSDRAQWLSAALHACGARTIRHSGKHKYAIRIGRTRAERSRTTLTRPAVLAFPKRPAQLEILAPLTAPA